MEESGAEGKPRRALAKRVRDAEDGGMSEMTIAPRQKLLGQALRLEHLSVGWWWADPLAALGMCVMLVREGREAWRGESCGCATR